MNKCRDALEAMVWQFGYQGVRDGKPIIWTGGLSALEEAFEALGWEDPRFVEDSDAICDVEGCPEWTVSQGVAWEDTGYWHICHKHSAAARNNELQPQMKQRAIDREASRDPITGYLP